MGAAIGAVLAAAVGVGISPIPIVAGILVLFSERARTNGPLFLLGWLVSLTGLLVVVVISADGAGAGEGGTTDDAIAWGKVALGVVLLGAAARKWRGRPRDGEEPTLPAWMASMESIAPLRALGLGALLALNPKNLALAIAAGASLAALDPSPAEAAVAIATFVAVGSAAVTTAVAYHRLGGAAAGATLDRAKGWLLANNTTVMTLLFLVFGAVLISNGLQGT